MLDPHLASYGITNYSFAIGQLAQTTLRSEIGKIELDRTFEARATINANVVSELDKASVAWGVKVMRYEIKNITPPKDVLSAMEKQMRAERDRRAAILTAEGVKQSAILTAEGEKQSAVLKAEGVAVPFHPPIMCSNGRNASGTSSTCGGEARTSDADTAHNPAITPRIATLPDHPDRTRASPRPCIMVSATSDWGQGAVDRSGWADPNASGGVEALGFLWLKMEDGVRVNSMRAVATRWVERPTPTGVW